LLMGMPLGEAIVILEELRPMSRHQPEAGTGDKPPAGKSLLDYSDG